MSFFKLIYVSGFKEIFKKEIKNAPFCVLSHFAFVCWQVKKRPEKETGKEVRVLTSAENQKKRNRFVVLSG